MGDCPSTCRQSDRACRRMGHKKQDVANMSFLRFKSLSSILADDEFRDASPLAAVFFGRFFSFSFFLTTLVHKESRLNPKIASFVAPCGSSTTLRCAAIMPPPPSPPVPCTWDRTHAHCTRASPSLRSTALFRPKAVEPPTHAPTALFIESTSLCPVLRDALTVDLPPPSVLHYFTVPLSSDHIRG